MTHPQIMDEREGLERIAMNILNMQSWTADKRQSSSLGAGQGTNNSLPQKTSTLQNVTEDHTQQALVNMVMNHLVL
jgi:hypothetical protein